VLDIHLQQGPTTAYLVFSPHRGRWQHPYRRPAGCRQGRRSRHAPKRQRQCWACV